MYAYFVAFGSIGKGWRQFCERQSHHQKNSLDADEVCPTPSRGSRHVQRMEHGGLLACLPKGKEVMSTGTRHPVRKRKCAYISTKEKPAAS